MTKIVILVLLMYNNGELTERELLVNTESGCHRIGTAAVFSDGFDGYVCKVSNQYRLTR